MTLEHTIQSQIMVAVNQHGCTLIRTNTGQVKTDSGRFFNAGPPNGWPDLTGYRHIDGKIILIEVKNERGRLRDDQKRFAKMIAKYPVLYGVCRSVDDAIKLISRD